MRIGGVILIQRAGKSPPPVPPRAPALQIGVIVPASVAPTLQPPVRGDAACLTLLMAQSYGARAAAMPRARAYHTAEPEEPIFSLTA